MIRVCKFLILVFMGFGIINVSHAQGVVGAYERLSASNKKVAEALFNGQVVTDNGKDPLSLDQIAAAKRRSGWGRIFRKLKKDGLLEARNLRELTSGRYERSIARKSRSRKSKKGGSSTVVTTAAGRQIIVGKDSASRVGGRNTGRDKNRRGSASYGKHQDKLFNTSTTYRGRLDNAAQSDGAAAIGITSGNGAPTSNIITK